MRTIYASLFHLASKTTVINFVESTGHVIDRELQKTLQQPIPKKEFAQVVFYIKRVENYSQNMLDFILCFSDFNDYMFLVGRSNIGDKISQTKSSTGSRTITNKLKRNMRTTAMTRKLTTGVFKTTNAPHITGWIFLF